MALSAKQIRFCEEYLIDLNGTQAAIRAGYSKKTANEQAARLLAKVNVHAYVTELKNNLTAKTLVSAEMVLEGLKEVAFRCLQKRPVLKWDYELKLMVQETDGEGNGIWEFDSNGANRSFELLGKHIGLFEKDNSQKKPEQVILNFTKAEGCDPLKPSGN